MAISAALAAPSRCGSTTTTAGLAPMTSPTPRARTQGTLSGRLLSRGRMRPVLHAWALPFVAKHERRPRDPRPPLDRWIHANRRRTVRSGRDQRNASRVRAPDRGQRLRRRLRRDATVTGCLRDVDGPNRCCSRRGCAAGVSSSPRPPNAQHDEDDNEHQGYRVSPHDRQIAAEHPVAGPCTDAAGEEHEPPPREARCAVGAIGADDLGQEAQRGHGSSNQTECGHGT
jgi:hypothetical protein